MQRSNLLTAKVLIVILSVMIFASPATAQVITNLSYDLTSLTEPELLADWVGNGAGVRSGIRVTTAAGDTRTYTHSTLPVDGEAFLMDTVVSAEGLGADIDRGVKIWVRFAEPTAPPVQVRHAEVRLYREAGTYLVGLFGTSGAGTALGSLPQDWTSAADRLRIRIRYQEIAGVGTVFLEAENSSQWRSDLAGPLTPDSSNTFSVLVNGANFPAITGSSEFGFGNAVAGAYYADYQAVQLIRSSEPDTVLPVVRTPTVPVPVLKVSGYAVLVILLAIGGWFFSFRE